MDNPFGPTSYPNILPPQNGMGLGPTFPLSTMLPNVPMPTQPDMSQPATLGMNNLQNPPGGPTNNQTPDIFTQIKNMVGGAFGAVGSFLDADKHWIAHPIYEGVFHPDQLINATMQFAGQGDHTPGKLVDLINEQYERNNDPGIAKFAGDIAFDPLTYLSSGVIKGIQVGADIGKIAIPGIRDIPLAGEALAKTLDPLHYGMTKYEQGIDAAMKGVSNFATGVATNNIPLSQAKDVARGSLNTILPSGLVEGILNAVPEEYNGVNIGPVADWINDRTNMGLPRQLAMPEFRVIQTGQSYSNAFQAAQQSFSAHGINYVVGADTNSILSHLRNVVSSPVESLSPNDRAVQDVIARPAPPSIPQIKALNKAAGGNLSDPDIMHQLAINNVLEQYARGPTISGTADGIDEATAIQGISQLLGNNPKANADSVAAISSFLDRQTAEADNFIASQKDKPAYDVIQNIAYRAKDRTDKLFSMGVTAQRMQNTWIDQMLNAFDSKFYQPIWQGFINKWINQPLTAFSVGSLGMQFMQPAEAYLRHIVEGGGERLPMDPQTFGRLTSNIDGVPDTLRQLHPPHYTEPVDQSLLAKLSNWNPVSGWAVDKAEALSDWSRNWTYTTRMSYWWKMFQNNLTDTRNALGIPIRDDMKSFWANTTPPDVTQVPNLANINQDLVNDAFMGLYTNPGSSDTLQGVKSALQTADVNKKDLSHIVDDSVVMDQLYAGPRAALRRAILNNPTSTENINQAVDAAIEQQKKLLTVEPQAMADIFKGSLQQMQDSLNYQYYSPADLRAQVNMVNAMQQQFAGIPNLMNQAEQDELSQIHGTVAWRSSLHTAYSEKMQASLDAIRPTLDKAHEMLAQAGDKWGLRPEVENITNNMKLDNELLYNTHIQANEWQKDFFAKKPNRKLDSTWNDPVVGYYPQKGRIWDGYNATHTTFQNNILQGQMDLMDKIAAGQAAGTIAPPVNTLENAVGLAKSAKVEVTPEQIATATVPPAPPTLTPTLDMKWRVLQAGQHQSDHEGYTALVSRQGKQWTTSVVRPDGTQIPSPTDWSIIKNLNDAKQFANMQVSGDIEHTKWRAQWEAEHGDPATEQYSNIIDLGLSSGDSPKEITNAINAAISPGAGISGEESVINPSSTSVGTQISGAASNDTINAGGNATAANPNDVGGSDPSTWINNKYSALDNTLRPRLNELIQGKLNNPAMNDTAYTYLASALDKVYSEYSALPPESKAIMDDASKEAVTRTNQMYNQAFTNYDSKNNFDQLMLHFVPFWMHESRRWPWLTRTFIGKPSMTSAWTAYQDNTDQGYVPLRDVPIVGGMVNMLPGGNSWQVNPFRLVSPLNPIAPTNQFRPAYFTGGLSGAMQNIDQTMQQLGINFGDMWDVPEAIAQGQPGTLLPPPLKSAISVARATNIPVIAGLAANIQQMLPDNYRDYYTRMILASQGFEPDRVYNGALDGDPTDTATLDVAQQQSSLVSAVLAQSGVLRYRTPEWSAYQQARAEALESMTGIPVYDLNQLKNQGVSIQQLKALTPLQRDELANIPGSRAFNELSEPLLNPAARKMRELQNQFYQTVDDSRTDNNEAQTKDDQRFQNGLISGVEWRRRYQDRAQTVGNLIDDLKRSPAYKNVPVSSDEQAAARARFNLPPFVQSAEDILLNQYYAIKPEPDPITGDINFSDFFDKRQALLDQHPDLQAVLDSKLASNNTVQVVDFKRASQVLRPYFSIPDQIEAQHPEIQSVLSQLRMLSNTDKIAADKFREIHPEISTLNKIIRQTQQQARMQFPQIDQALVKYYGATPIDYEEQRRGRTSQSGNTTVIP